jgi:hypothetical protein
MAFFPGCSSISPIFCPFYSPSLGFCFLSQEQRPVLRDFHSLDQVKLFSNLIAQFVGIAIFTPISYVWSTENFPTRARVVGFALADGIGHIGGGIAVFAVGSIIAGFGGWGFFLLLGGYYLAAAGISFLGTRARDKRLDEIAP